MSYTYEPFSITVPLNNATYNTNGTYFIGNLTSISTSTQYSNATNPYPKLTNMSYTINLPSQSIQTNGSSSYLVGKLISNTVDTKGNISFQFSFAQNYSLNVNCISILSTEENHYVNPSLTMTMKDATNNPVYNPTEPGQTTSSTIVVNGSNMTNFYYYNGTELRNITNPDSTIQNEIFVITDEDTYYVTYCDQSVYPPVVPIAIDMFSGVSNGSIVYDLNFRANIIPNSNVYIANFQIFGTLRYYTPPPPPPVILSTALPISNICFVSNTPIETDQGTIAISKIDPNIHTIQNNKIRAITRTIYENDYLLCIHKNAFADKYPSKDVILSKEHKIMIPPISKMHKDIQRYFHSSGKNHNQIQFLRTNKIAEIFESMPEKLRHIRKVPYHGETLFNILLDKKGCVIVNNMVCETLDPENIIAKLYMSTLGPEYKNQIVYMMNDSILKKDMAMLKRIAGRLFMPVYNKELLPLIKVVPISLQEGLDKIESKEEEEIVLYDPIHPISVYKPRSRIHRFGL